MFNLDNRKCNVKIDKEVNCIYIYFALDDGCGGKCGIYAECVTHACQCQPGYVGNGYTCQGMSFKSSKGEIYTRREPLM